MKIIDALRSFKTINIIDQCDISKEYSITWDDVNEFCSAFENEAILVSDEADEDGFETAVWEKKYDNNEVIQLTTVYGIGSFSMLKLVSEATT
jgi:hypothetical protein